MIQIFENMFGPLNAESRRKQTNVLTIDSFNSYKTY